MMKRTMMMMFGVLTMLLGTSLSSPVNPRDLTRHQIRQLSDYVFTLEARKLELENKAEQIKRQPNQVAIGRACLTDQDCPSDSMCIDMLQVLALFLAENDALRHFDVITRKAQIGGRECWSDPSPALARIPADDLLERIVTAKREIGRVYAWFDERAIVLTRPASLDSGNADEITARTHDVRAAVRQGAGMDLNTMMLVLAMRGNDGTGGTLDKLLPILLMQNAGSAGAGGDLMSNPILMMMLLNNNKDSTSSSDLLLMMSVMQGGNVAAGGASTNLMSSPLLLMSLLKPSGGDAKTSVSDMLPLLMMSGGMGAGSSDLMSNPILLTTLLNGKDDDSLTKMLPLLMMGGMGGAGGDISSMLPMIVLMNRKDGSTTTSSDLLPLILMMGQGGSGAGQQDIGKMLPILLMNNKDMKTEDLLPIIMMMSGQGGDMQSMLPLMMLIGGGHTKDDGHDHSNDNVPESSLSKMLPLLMMMGGTDKGGMQSMLPLMMASGSNLKTEDLMMMMMLGQGADNMQAMMPLLLLKSSSSSSMESLLPLMMLGGGGEGEGSLDVMPLLYNYPDQFSDIERSMLIMMGMADKLKSDSLTYDPETGLVVVDKNSPLNMILPMVMMKKQEDTTDQMMLMIFMFSLMEGRREIQVVG